MQRCQQKLEKSSLYDVYMQIPQHEEISHAISHHVPHTVAHTQSSTVLDMPKDMLMLIFSFLSANSLASLSGCCRYLRDSSKLVIPGLELKLFPHQENSGNIKILNLTRAQSCG